VPDTSSLLLLPMGRCINYLDRNIYNPYLDIQADKYYHHSAVPAKTAVKYAPTNTKAAFNFFMMTLKYNVITLISS